MEEYKSLLELFSQHLNKHTHGLTQLSPKELYEPEGYILSLGGKRLRPLLALIACDLFGKDPRQALNSALAVELFHNFSLIHDDILDAAPLRRNKPTVHAKWNTNIAILSGDVMLVKAFQALENYDSALFASLTKLFNKTAIEVCEGQQLDMNFENLSGISVEDYLNMITKKTAVLLGCSLKMGGMIASASESDQEHLYEFGKHLGISFQFMDDLLDAFAKDSEKFGKQPGGDIIANKKTFLLLKARELAGEAQKKEMDKYLDIKDADKKIKGIRAIYNDLGIEALCQQEADKHTQTAIDHLDKIKADPTRKENLKTFAKGLLQRQI